MEREKIEEVKEFTYLGYKGRTGGSGEGKGEEGS